MKNDKIVDTVVHVLAKIKLIKLSAVPFLILHRVPLGDRCLLLYAHLQFVHYCTAAHTRANCVQ